MLLNRYCWNTRIETNWKLIPTTKDGSVQTRILNISISLTQPRICSRLLLFLLATPTITDLLMDKNETIMQSRKACQNTLLLDQPIILSWPIGPCYVTGLGSCQFDLPQSIKSISWSGDFFFLKDTRKVLHRCWKVSEGSDNGPVASNGSWLGTQWASPRGLWGVTLVTHNPCLSISPCIAAQTT